MAESREGSPATNFKKTEMAQSQRVESATTPNGFMDKLRGKYVFGHVQANYTAGRGGDVETQIKSGKASLTQHWRFDENGDIAAVWVHKNYDGSTRPVKSEHLVRGSDGKFKVSESTSSGIYSQDWDREFSTVRKRTQSPKR